MREFDACQRTMLFDGRHDSRQRLDVLVVVHPRIRQGRVVRRLVDHGLLEADDTPATLGSSPAEGNHLLECSHPHRGCMGHDVESVLGPDGTDLHGFEQDVISGIAHL